MTDIRETLARAILDGMLKSGEAVTLSSGYAAAAVHDVERYVERIRKGVDGE